MVLVSNEVNQEGNTGTPFEEEYNVYKEFPKVLKDIEESTAQLETLVDNLKLEVKSGKLNSKEGISLLDVKNQMMLNYISNVVYVIAKKLHGLSIEEDSAIVRLVEIRTVLERVRPLEQKLKYMMEKLVKTALTGVGNENDPTHFRANPENMAANMAGSESESEDESFRQKGREVWSVRPTKSCPHALRGGGERSEPSTEGGGASEETSVAQLGGGGTAGRVP